MWPGVVGALGLAGAERADLLEIKASTSCEAHAPYTIACNRRAYESQA